MNNITFKYYLVMYLPHNYMFQPNCVAIIRWSTNPTKV